MITTMSPITGLVSEWWRSTKKTLASSVVKDYRSDNAMPQCANSWGMPALDLTQS